MDGSESSSIGIDDEAYHIFEPVLTSDARDQCFFRHVDFLSGSQCPDGSHCYTRTVLVRLGHRFFEKNCQRRLGDPFPGEPFFPEVEHTLAEFVP